MVGLGSLVKWDYHYTHGLHGFACTATVYFKEAYFTLSLDFNVYIQYRYHLCMNIALTSHTHNIITLIIIVELYRKINLFVYVELLLLSSSTSPLCFAYIGQVAAINRIGVILISCKWVFLPFFLSFFLYFIDYTWNQQKSATPVNYMMSVLLVYMTLKVSCTGYLKVNLTLGIHCQNITLAKKFIFILKKDYNGTRLKKRIKWHSVTGDSLW